ncbi:MAG: hypothetical protein RL172_1067 [Bacteroidota bacterium]|jgi:ABC-2 type transport system ATP-binding protein
MLSISDFSKTYPGCTAPVLSIPSLQLQPGIYWLYGQNGSGKTSLVKSIAGLLPFKGSIAVNNIDIHRQRMAYTRLVNYAEAEPLYPPFVTGNDLLSFYHQTKKGQLPQAFIQAIGLDKFSAQKISTYSSGMIKKLSLALAFTGNPALILLDEPLIALDTDAVEQLQQTIKQYLQAGVSFLITSHQPLNLQLLPGLQTLQIHDKQLQQPAA